MPQSTSQKLRIEPGMKLLTIDAPKEFKATLEPLPADVTISTSTIEFDQVHWFVRTRAELYAKLAEVMKLLKDDVTCWLYFPKGSSKMQTDLTRDRGWEELTKYEVKYLNLVSFDGTWSAFGFKRNADTTAQKSAKPARKIFDYIDTATRTIHLPEDLKQALEKHQQAMEYFGNLSFTNKKEYVEWVVTAKKEDTRRQRVEATIERLQKSWKNPSNL